MPRCRSSIARVQSTSSIQSFTVEIAKAAHNVPVDDKLFVKP